LNKQQVIGSIGQFTVHIIFCFIQTEDSGAKTSVLCIKSFVESVFPKLICVTLEFKTYSDLALH